MGPRGSRWLLCFLVLSSTCPAYPQGSPAKNPNAAPRFSISARAVVVDVVVTGVGDQPVAGLLSRDFTVLEDGKEQTIDFFEEHALTGAASAAVPPLPPNVFSNKAGASPGNSINVVLLDELNTAPKDQHALFTGMGDFLKGLAPGARVAIFVLRSKLELVRGFTSDIPAVQRALRDTKITAGAEVAAGTRTQQDDADDRLTSALYEASGANYTGGEAIRQLQTSQGNARTLQALEQIGRNLAGVPDRKNLIWFADSFPLSLFPRGSDTRLSRRENDDGRNLRKAVGMLAEAKIAVYPVSVQGVVNSVSTEAEIHGESNHTADIARADEEQTAARNANNAAMVQLADETGGQAVYNTNNFIDAATRAMRDGEHYYTLAYTPANGQEDGKVRHIEVKLDRQNVKLSYRRGYYARVSAANEALKAADPLPPLLAHGMPPAAEVLYRAQVQPVSPQPSPDSAFAGGNATLVGPTVRYGVDFKVDVSSLELEAAPNGAHTGNVETALVAYDRDGKALNWAGSLNRLALNAASYDAAERSGLPLHMEIDVPRSAVSLATGVYDLGAQKAGTLEAPLTVAAPAVSVAQNGEASSPAEAPAEEKRAGNAPAPTGAEAAPQPGPGQPEAAHSAVIPDPMLVHRPPPKPPSAVVPEGHMALDVVVNDAAGKPVTGLQAWDFKVLDNHRPSKILSFRSFDGGAVKPDPPVEVILLIDELNLPFAQVSFVKSEVADFLRQNGGRLAQPVSIMLLTEAGLQVQPRPSTDGNALLNVVNQIKGHVSSINPAMGSQGALERTQISVHQLATIAENMATKPGRKLLIWIGPGWPMLQSSIFRFSERDRRRYFDAIVELTNRLREARIVLYSVVPGGTSGSLLYQSFLKGVATEKEADVGDLGLKVLVTNTGGRILGPDNDVAGQIDQCAAEANAFYRLSFDPPHAEHADEYHELKVAVNQAGATVRTNAAYYNEPPGN